MADKENRGTGNVPQPEGNDKPKKPNIFKRIGTKCSEIAEDIRENPVVMAIGGGIGAGLAIGGSVLYKAFIKPKLGGRKSVDIPEIPEMMDADIEVPEIPDIGGGLDNQ